ncbi:PAS domain-containing protein [Marinomonas ostreistagni]|uniref:PAS domain-containing protein n=1 Tax=Marinomonas ostreistagni TaxID=359209 RepID=UPI00194DEEF9|nr:PAS domain-containing protein [Marinomonas ostreistagni]MBM6550740.1 PAS domain S-box protein [Marinomonas ostreistagni]
MSDSTPQYDGFEAVFRHSKDGLAIFKDGYFVDCNQSMIELVGGTQKEDFLGLTPFEFSPEYQFDGQSSAEKGMAYINQCYAEGSVRFEWIHKKLNGEPFWCEVILTKMELNGEVVAHTNWRDISEKKQLELDLAEQKETFETLFNESMDGLCVYDGKQYVDCNKAFLKMFGFAKKEDAIGLNPGDISPEFQADGRPSKIAAREIVQDSMEKGSVRFEWVHKRVDGTEFWTEVIVTKVMLNGVNSIYAVIRDISEKKNLELELADQKLTFETLFNESVDGLTFFDGERYLDCNKAFLQLMGFQHKSEVIGLNPLTISPSHQADGRTSEEHFDDRAAELFEHGSTRFEWLHKKTDGTPFWTEVIVGLLSLNGREVTYSITRDISEKKALELEIVERNEALNQSNADLEDTIDNLKQTQDKLVESEKMASLGSLVAGVAHEINTPVGVGLMGITQFLEDSYELRQRYDHGQLTETDFESFLNNANDISELVKKNLERTAHLVKGFKQIAVDQTSEEERQINLNDYCEEVVFSLGSVIRKARVSVEIDCAPDLNVVTNPGLLSQVLTNLIVNSMNHGFGDQGTGTIRIALREQSEQTFVLSYKDNGKGISAANLPKIFDPFFTTNRGQGGTGLGLNVTYNIVTGPLAGAIRCTSQEGHGVEFTISFKVKQRL